MPNTRHQQNIIEHLHNVIQQRICHGLRFGRKQPRDKKRKILITVNQYYFLKQSGVRGDVYNRNDALTHLLKLKFNLRMMKDLECECRTWNILFVDFVQKNVKQCPAKKFEFLLKLNYILNLHVLNIN